VPVLTGTDAHPASCTMGSGCLSGVKEQGRGVEVANGLELHLCLHSVTGQTYHGFTFTFYLCMQHEPDGQYAYFTSTSNITQ